MTPFWHGHEARNAIQYHKTDDLPVSVTFSGTAGFRYHSCRPDEFLIKTGMGVQKNGREYVGKKTYAPGLALNRTHMLKMI
jgi:hypothetical protein